MMVLDNAEVDGVGSQGCDLESDAESEIDIII
jgi:hypothetical protein